jgi:7-cyano-7-deazaguanine reductase
VETAPRSSELVALGQPGPKRHAALQTFANPGVSRVEMRSDELTAVCPVTGQPDLYVATIEY